MVETKFDEGKIVNGLCKSSREFNDFYQKERKKYDDKIEWFQEPNLKEGLGAYANLLTKKENCKVYFKKFPDASDDFLIAHEIMHVIRAIETILCGEER